jgi:hypothetical protein
VRIGGPVNTHHAENRRVVVDITGATGANTTTTRVTTPVVTTPTVTTPTINVPLAPTIVSAVAADSSTTLTITPPSSDATLTITPPSSDATITGYEYSLDGGTTWLPLTTTGTSTLTATITGLTDGTSYSILVRAASSAGKGAASASASATPSTVPAAPDLISGTAANAVWPARDWLTTLSWTAPTSDGGSPITAWDVTQDGTDLGAMSGVTDTSGTYSVTFDTGWDYCSWSDANTPYTVEGVNARGDGVTSRTVDINMDYPC